MSVTAAQLRKTGTKSKVLNTFVQEQLLVIDERLNRADRTWGRNVMAHELAINFPIPGLARKDAQRLIYSAIVRSLTERGFTVRLLLEKARTVLYTEWVADINAADLNAMNRLIRQVRIEANEIPGYLDRGFGDEPDGAGEAKQPEARRSKAAAPPAAAPAAPPAAPLAAPARGQLEAPR